MSSIDQIQSHVNVAKSYLRDKYAIDSLFLFGSYARGEETKKSDIDILVDFKKTPDLLTFIEIEEYLSHILQSTVDLVPKRKLKPQLKDAILKEAILL